MARPHGSDGDKTVAVLREAAATLFAAKGYAATSMRDIAAKIGVQPGAIYHYFPTKQAILVHLLTVHMDELLEAARTALAPGAPPAQRLESFIRFHFQHHISRADDVFISYMELRALEPANFERINALRSQYEAIIADILAAGVEESVFKVRDLRVTSKAVLGMLTGVHTWFREDGRLDAADVEEIYCGLIKRMVIAAAPEAPS